MDNAPIGIFDSGLGGLTVARAVIDKLPDEEILYLATPPTPPTGLVQLQKRVASHWNAWMNSLSVV